MLVVRYYRLYIVVYIYSLIALMVAAFAFDGYAIANGGDHLKFPKFITSIIILIFSYTALLLRHVLIEKIIDVDKLKLQPKLWFKEFLKKKIKTKLSKKSVLVFSHIILFFIFLFPLLIGELTHFFLPAATPYFYCRIIALIGTLLKGISWFTTLFLSKIFIFWNKKRLLELS